MRKLYRMRGLVGAALLLALGVGPAPAHDQDDSSPAGHHAAGRDGFAYPVSGFELVWTVVADHPVLRALPDLEVALGQVAEGFVEPRDDVPQTEVRLGSAPYSNYYVSALQAIRQQVTEHLRDEGFVGVIVYPSEEQIDPETGRDLRSVGQVGLRLLVRTDGKPKRRWFR